MLQVLCHMCSMKGTVCTQACNKVAPSHRRAQRSTTDHQQTIQTSHCVPPPLLSLLQPLARTLLQVQGPDPTFSIWHVE
jgi:hypothetical protein